jgi:hypothetical protein
LVFNLRDNKGLALMEVQALALSKERQVVKPLLEQPALFQPTEAERGVRLEALAVVLVSAVSLWPEAIDLNVKVVLISMGGVNEKIDGYFRVCETLGLDGSQVVLLPHRNRRHLMLDCKAIEAVERDQFHIYTADHMREGIALLTGQPSGT